MKKNALSDVDWEIHQLSLAIKYYEKAREESRCSSDCNKYDTIINDLHNQIRDLEIQHYELKEQSN